ncbi:MAG: hypothetical protein AAGI44_09180 [Pseudomonadota bacterium]
MSLSKGPKVNRPCRDEDTVDSSVSKSYAWRSPWTTTCALLLMLGMSACKLQIQVPPGGKVITESQAITCLPRNNCDIDVVDQFFNETFIARPNKGFAFMGWEQVSAGFCGSRYEPCTLSTANFDLFPSLLAILAGDDVFYLRPRFAPIPTIKEEDIVTEGDVEPTGDGLKLDGNLELNTGQGPSRLFKDANLALTFNAEGDLQAMNGEGILPRNITDSVELVGADVLAEIGYFTGEEINANEEIPINLREERQYLVFLMSAGITVSKEVIVPGDEEPKLELEEVTFDTPASGKVIMILDPNDDMEYRYGETPLKGAFGEALSEQGLIPFVPYYEGNSKIYRFDGHMYKTISQGIGIKALDVFNVTGEQVTSQPSLFDVDLADPFNSPFAYRAGVNGSAEVAISVFGFSARDYFQFDLAEASASVEVSKNRQILTLAAELAPDVSWLPEWMPIFPEYGVAFDLSAKGDGSVELNLSGSYTSILPAAEIEGSMRLTPQELVLRGSIVGQRTLPLTARFADGNTFGTVGVTADFSELVESEIGGAFDRAEDRVAQAIADLEQAVADFEFELSLRGLRGSIPGIADAAINELNDVPDLVYDEVYDEVRAEINTRNECFTNPISGRTSCLISNTRRNDAAEDAAEQAEDDAEDRIKPYIASLRELKRSALEDNNEDLIDTLESALREAYANRTFSESFTVSVEVDIVGPNITFSETRRVTATILSSSQADQILMAADNIDRIPETSELVVSAQELVDRVPTQQIIDQARQAVDAQATAIPAVSGITYAIEDEEYLGTVEFSDGSRYEVNFNVLDWQELSEGIADLVAQFAIDNL